MGQHARQDYKRGTRYLRGSGRGRESLKMIYAELIVE